jgi:PmbA protein
MKENRLNNPKELDLAKEALEISLKSGAQQARVTLNMGMQNAFAVLDGKLDRLHMTNDRSLYIQLYSNGRYGVFSTNRMDRGELKHFIKEAVTASSLLAEDKCRTLPDKELYFKGEEEDLMQFDPLVLTMSPDEKKRMAFEAYREMEGKSDLVVSANAEYGDYTDYQYFVDSQGFEGEILQSGFSISAECSVKGKSNARPEAWWYDSAMLFSEFNPHGCGEIALNRALAKLSPKKIKSGKYTMIVENSCSSRLISPIFSALNGSNIQQNNSFLLNKLGEKVFPEHMNIIDTPHMKGMSGSRYFDSEGIATKERKIIDNGVVNTYFINNGYKENNEPFGRQEYWDGFWKTMYKYPAETRTEYTDGEFADALEIYRNQSIQDSISSQDPLVRMFAVLDRRIGKRTLERIKPTVDDQPDWLKQFYLLRLNAE